MKGVTFALGKVSTSGGVLCFEKCSSEGILRLEKCSPEGISRLEKCSLQKFCAWKCIFQDFGGILCLEECSAEESCAWESILLFFRGLLCLVLAECSWSKPAKHADVRCSCASTMSKKKKSVLEK